MRITHSRRPIAALFAGVCLVWAAPSSAQQDLELPRSPGAKLSLGQMWALPAADKVVVKFHEGRSIRQSAGRLTGMTGAEAAAFADVLRISGVAASAVRRLHALSEGEVDQERIAAEWESGRAVADLNLYYVIDLPAGVDAAVVADRLNALPMVEFAEPGPRPAPPPVYIPPTTPNLTSFQGYKKAPPQGIGALNPTRFPGGDGKAVRVVDVEYSWQLDHEDLKIPAARVLTGGATASDPFADTNHGTAVLGEIVGRRNGYGVTGIAPAAVPWVAPANTVEFGYDPARAIGLATAKLRRGEVMVIEQQTWVCGFGPPGTQYGPLEWIQSVFDAISAATAKGIIVVEAAGNGNVNLDQPACMGLFDRRVRNSRAIIVGAGSSTAHAHLGFSSYGSRVDVQGWGENVTTAGYGDAFNPGDVRQFYTHSFDGTSSATPIVAGAVLAMQGVVKECGLPLLRPMQIRNALVSTGTRQPGAAGNRIGPLPRIRPALQATPASVCLPPA